MRLCRNNWNTYFYILFSIIFYAIPSLNLLTPHKQYDNLLNQQIYSAFKTPTLIQHWILSDKIFPSSSLQWRIAHVFVFGRVKQQPFKHIIHTKFQQARSIFMKTYPVHRFKYWLWILICRYTWLHLDDVKKWHTFLVLYKIFSINEIIII